MHSAKVLTLIKPELYYDRSWSTESWLIKPILEVEGKARNEMNSHHNSGGEDNKNDFHVRTAVGVVVVGRCFRLLSHF